MGISLKLFLFYDWVNRLLKCGVLIEIFCPCISFLIVDRGGSEKALKNAGI
jgi:hypothetical protein